MNIIKRDGTVQPFNSNKIVDAVLAAFQEVDGEITDYAVTKANNIAEYVKERCEALPEGEMLDIEKIQDYVESGLQSTKRKDVAKAYILYREDRRKLRNKNSAFIKTINEKLMASKIQNQNANVDEGSFGGRMGEATSAMTRQMALDYVLSPMARNNHLANEIYIHDLDHYIVGDHNCLSLPLDDLLAKGFNTRQVDIRPAGSINTAF